MTNMNNFDFSKVILGTDVDLALVGQAAIDGLLVDGSDGSLTPIARKKRNKQEALSLLVLFDNLVLTDLAGGNYHIPILEQEGILSVSQEQNLLVKDFEDSDWYGNRNRDAFIKALDRTVAVRPLVLEYLTRRKDKFVQSVADALDSTRKETLNAIIDFAHSHYLKDRSRLQSNPLYQKLPPDLIKLFRGKLNRERDRDGLNAIDTIIFGATHAGALLEHYASMSQALGCGVATSEFSAQGYLWNKQFPVQKIPEKIPPAFCILRAALHDSGAFFPKIENIKHAMQLRKDPNIKAFRQQLTTFQRTLLFGDSSDIYKAVREVHQATEALKRNSTIQQGLKWLTYASLPLSVAETLLNGLPVASLSLSLFSIAVTNYSERIRERHRWVLFGR